MTPEATEFLKNNKHRLLMNYREYLEGMIEQGEVEEVENFWEWVEEEYKVCEEKRLAGTPLSDYDN